GATSAAAGATITALDSSTSSPDSSTPMAADRSALDASDGVVPSDAPPPSAAGPALASRETAAAGVVLDDPGIAPIEAGRVAGPTVGADGVLTTVSAVSGPDLPTATVDAGTFAAGDEGRAPAASTRADSMHVGAAAEPNDATASTGPEESVSSSVPVEGDPPDGARSVPTTEHAAISDRLADQRPQPQGRRDASNVAGAAAAPASAPADVVGELAAGAVSASEASPRAGTVAIGTVTSSGASGQQAPDMVSADSAIPSGAANGADSDPDAGGDATGGGTRREALRPAGVDGATSDAIDGATDEGARLESTTTIPTETGPRAAETASTARTVAARAAEQVAMRELFEQIERQRIASDGTLELEILTERFGALRIEAVDGGDGVELSLRGDGATQDDLADLARQLREQLQRHGTELGDLDLRGDRDRAGGSVGADPSRAATTTDADADADAGDGAALSVGGSGLDLRL
ncbi:MAG: hypothetical protein AAGG08_17275, partial [Actinomycetota bacterium]